MKLTDISKYKLMRENVAKTIEALWNFPDHKIENVSGRATTVLYDLVTPLDRSGKPIKPYSYINTLNKMQELGWIKMDIRGKQNYSVELVDTPEDWQPVYQINEEALQELTEETEKLGLYDQEPDEAELLGGRPGRLAARIERTIPALVEEGVTNAVIGILGKLLPTPDYHTDTEAIIAPLQMEIDELKADLRAEQQAAQVVRENWNSLMRKEVSTRDTSPVKPHQLKGESKKLGEHAVSHHWTLHYTPGGHVMFKSPEGARYYHPSTASDWRSVKNALSDMYKMGLPRMD